MSNEGLILSPLITEKGTAIGAIANQVAFKVRPGASKHAIAAVIEEQFKVTVLKVRTARFIGKTRRRNRLVGKQRDWKKAYVTLKAGDRIEFFEGV